MLPFEEVSTWALEAETKADERSARSHYALNFGNLVPSDHQSLNVNVDVASFFLMDSIISLYHTTVTWEQEPAGFGELPNLEKLYRREGTNKRPWAG